MSTATTNNPVKVWQTTLGELEVTISKASFQTWFRNTTILRTTDETIVIGVPNTFAQAWLRDKYHKEILSSLKQFYPDATRIEYEVAASTSGPTTARAVPTTETLTQPTSNARIEESQPIPDESTLNDQYTFETFVVGNSNRLAHAAASAIVEHPGASQYNPLFIYGGVGLGKTHLMQAIGNAIRSRHPKKTVVYASCERFTSEFVQALQTKRLEAFKRRYRNADVLLIDDIQFFSGKDGIQQEFFHTFNTLHQTKRQIIMTSDQRPLQIPQLQPRLSSRFGMGMVADMSLPDLETRQAILKHKCEEKRIVLADDIVAHVAQQVQSNIRELEGALNGIIAHCELYNVSPSLKLVEKILEQTGVDRRLTHITAETISQTIADYFSLEVAELLGKRRNKELVYPRQIAMYLMKFELGYSFPKIGKALGGKDHTTVMHGVNKITRELSRDDSLQRDLTLIKERLYISG